MNWKKSSNRFCRSSQVDDVAPRKKALGLQPQGGRELRLKARPLARFISPSNAPKHININKPKTWVPNDWLTQNPPVSFFHESTGGDFSLELGNRLIES